MSNEINRCSTFTAGTDIYMKYVFSEPISYESVQKESPPVLRYGVGSVETRFRNRPKGYDIQSGECAPASNAPITTVVCRYTAAQTEDAITMRTSNGVSDVPGNLMRGTGWTHSDSLFLEGGVGISSPISDQILTQDVAMTTLTLPKASCDSGDGTYTYSLSAKGSGSLPDGLTFDSTATVRTLSGTPTTTQNATAYTYTVTGNSLTNSLDFNITVLPPPEINVIPESLQLVEGARGSFAVSLASPPVGGVVKLDLSTDNNNITVNPEEMTFTSNNWAVAQTATVATVPDDDSVSEDAKVIMNPSGANYESVQNAEPPVRVIESLVVSGGGYYLKNGEGSLVEITTVQTVPAFQGATKTSIYTKVVFSGSVKHVAASDSTARPYITYTMAPGSSVQYEIVDGTAALGDSQCQPYSGSVVAFKEYLCRYTVTTGDSGDDGDFGFGVGSATEDPYGNRVSPDYTHGKTVDVDARSPTVKTAESGYYSTYDKDTGAVSGKFTSCSALSSGTDIYMKYVFSEPIRYTSDRTESSTVFPVLMVGVGSNLTKFANKPKGYDIQSGQCAPASSSPVSTVICRHTATTAQEPITMKTTNAVVDIHVNYMSNILGWSHPDSLLLNSSVAFSSSISDQILTKDVAMTTLTLPKGSCDTGDGTYTYSLAPKGSGTLPDGLTFNSNPTSRTLSGTPTAIQNATTYTYTVTGNSLTNSLNFNITVLPRPEISVVPESLQLLEGESGSFAVSLMSPPQGGDVTLDLSTDNGKITVQPSSITFTGSDWTVAKTVTVATVSDDDSVSENAKVIMNPSGANYESLDNVESKVEVIESPIVSEGKYYLKNHQGSLIEITSDKTVSGYQKEVPSSIYTKVVFSKSVKHVAATGSTARPHITYTMAPGSAVQYEIVDGTAVLGDGQCQPYSGSAVAFQEYLCRYTVSTGNSGDDGDFYFGVGSATEDRYGNSLVSDYKHPTKVDVDARSPTVKTAESGYHLKNDQGSLVEITTVQTVPAFQGATKTSIYTKVVFSESVKHVAASGSTARPHITYTMAPGSAVQYEIVDGTAVLGDGQCQPYSDSVAAFQEYLCRYTVTTGNGGDYGEFGFGVGSATEDLYGNRVSPDYTHPTTVDVDARSHAVNAAESGYYLKNDQGSLVEITSGQTVSGFQKQVPSAIYTKVVFRESVRHVAASGAAARPNITYTMAPGSAVQYEIVDGTAVLGDGQCQPYSDSAVAFQEYLCRYTVTTGNSGDDGDFYFGVGSATEDRHGNSQVSDYTHDTKVDVDARSPTVKTAESGYYTTYNKDTGAVSNGLNRCDALSAGTDIYMKYVFSEPIGYESVQTESPPVLRVGVGSVSTRFRNRPKGYDIAER